MIEKHRRRIIRWGIIGMAFLLLPGRSDYTLWMSAFFSWIQNIFRDELKGQESSLHPSLFFLLPFSFLLLTFSFLPYPHSLSTAMLTPSPPSLRSPGRKD